MAHASNVPALLRTGLEHHRAGRLADAQASYRQILAQQPRHPDALHLMGVIALQAGRYAVAIEMISAAATLTPNAAEIHANLGEAYRRDGQLRPAAASLQRSLALDPSNANAHNNLGIVQKDLGHLSDAEQGFRHALALRPDHAEALNNLGGLLKDLGQRDDALTCFLHAAELQPGLFDVHTNLGNLYWDLGRLDESLASFRRALEIDPGSAKTHSCFIFVQQFHPTVTSETIRAEVRQWNDRHAAPLRGTIAPHRNDRQAERRLRIGYLSPDLRDHVVGLNVLPLFRHHDRTQFEVFAYIDVPKPDGITAQFRELADGARVVIGQSHEQVAAAIRADQIDVLVDLALHLAENRLPVFARKPAPVQVTFAGYPGTTGLETMDYRLTDPYLDPPNEFDALYAERSVRLPHSFWCYAPLSPEPAVNPLPAGTRGGVTFGCLNNFSKSNASTWRLWARVLRAVANSRLLLLAPVGSPRQRVAEVLAAEGIEPARLEFVAPVPRREYLASYHRIDLGLDTLPYNGHTTSLDSFWMGVPVVSLVGATVAGRGGFSQLSNLGLPELATRSPDEFVGVAQQLACDLPRLAALRAGLRERVARSPLMDAPRFTRDVEAAYRTMWRTWCATAG